MQRKPIKQLKGLDVANKFKRHPDWDLFGLTIDASIDDERDIIRATEAHNLICNYLLSHTNIMMWVLERLYEKGGFPYFSILKDAEEWEKKRGK